MLKRILTSIIALVFLTQTSFAQNQQTSRGPGDWSIVELLKTGEKLRVEMKSGKSVKGKLASVSQTDLSISERRKTTSLSRDDVSRVYQIVGRTRAKSTLRGAAIGGGIATGTATILYLPVRDDITGWVVPVFGLIGAGIGAGVGLVFGGGQRQVLIYQAA